jgi:hypothetical protein
VVTPLPPRARLTGAGTAVSGSRLATKLVCASASCKGRVKIERIVVVTVKKGKKRVREHRTVVLGSASYSAAAGKTVKLEIALNAAGRRALAAAKDHRLAVTLVLTVKGGAQTTRHETIHAVVKRSNK